jgi:hypothetical protein
MKASSSDVAAPARTELTTPAKSTAKPMRPIAIAASQVLREASVPAHTRTPPASPSIACACNRSRIGPPKSTSTSVANDPNAANVASSAFPMTLSPSANMTGMTIAVRPARRSAKKPRSRAASHWTS